jgi:hypothetical protein
VEVLRNTQNKRLIFRNTLGLVTPFPGNLDCRLDRFSTSVHRQHHIEIEVLGNELCKAWEDIVVESS